LAVDSGAGVSGGGGLTADARIGSIKERQPRLIRRASIDAVCDIGSRHRLSDACLGAQAVDLIRIMESWTRAALRWAALNGPA